MLAAGFTSHRARSTIASATLQRKGAHDADGVAALALGHKWVNSTQHYLDISPTKLAASYKDAALLRQKQIPARSKS